MTGFGNAQQRDRHLDIDVELRSVNHRFLTLKQSLPDPLSRCESEVEEMVRGALSRGSVSVSVSVKSSDPAQAALPDLELFRAYADRLRQIQKDLGIKGELEWGDLLAIPAIWSSANLPQPGPEVWPKVKKLLSRALQELSATRAREGDSIARDFKARLETIEDRLERVRRRAPVVQEAYQKRLDDRIQALLRQKGLEAAQVDIAKEVALYADRCDVSEEVQRLTAHIGEFRKIIGLKGLVGRRLDFLTQEMGREANTIASKANDSEISACAVEIKAELEKIKEQVDNVE